MNIGKYVKCKDCHIIALRSSSDDIREKCPVLQLTYFKD